MPAKYTKDAKINLKNLFAFFAGNKKNKLETYENQKILRDLPIGARLLVRSKKDWRSAVISRFSEEKATLIVCSPTGRTYRLYRLLDAEIVFDGKIPILKIEIEEDWRENFSKYDLRW